MRVLAGDKSDLLRLDDQVDLTRVKVFYMADDGGYPLVSRVDRELVAVQKEFVRRYGESQGVRGRRVALPGLYYSVGMWAAAMASGGGPSFAELLTECRGEVAVWRELVKWCLGLSDHTLPALGLALTEKWEDKEGEEHKRLLQRVVEARGELQDLLGQVRFCMGVPNCHQVCSVS